MQMLSLSSSSLSSCLSVLLVACLLSPIGVSCVTYATSYTLALSSSTCTLGSSTGSGNTILWPLTNCPTASSTQTVTITLNTAPTTSCSTTSFPSTVFSSCSATSSTVYTCTLLSKSVGTALSSVSVTPTGCASASIGKISVTWPAYATSFTVALYTGNTCSSPTSTGSGSSIAYSVTNCPTYSSTQKLQITLNTVPYTACSLTSFNSTLFSACSKSTNAVYYCTLIQQTSTLAIGPATVTPSGGCATSSIGTLSVGWHDTTTYATSFSISSYGTDTIHTCDFSSTTGAVTLSNCTNYGTLFSPIYVTLTLSPTPTFTCSAFPSYLTGCAMIGSTFSSFQCQVSSGGAAVAWSPTTCTQASSLGTLAVSYATQSTTQATITDCASSCTSIATFTNSLCSSGDGSGGLTSCPIGPVAYSQTVAVTLPAVSTYGGAFLLYQYTTVAAGYTSIGFCTSASTLTAGDVTGTCYLSTLGLPVDGTLLSNNGLSTSPPLTYYLVSRDTMVGVSDASFLPSSTALPSLTSITLASCSGSGTATLTGCSTTATGETITFTGAGFDPAAITSTTGPFSIPNADLAAGFGSYTGSLSYLCSDDLVISAVDTATCTYKGLSTGSSSLTITVYMLGVSGFQTSSTVTISSVAIAPTITSYSIGNGGTGGTVTCTYSSPSYSACPINSEDSASQPMTITFTGSGFPVVAAGAATCAGCASCNAVNSGDTQAVCTLASQPQGTVKTVSYTAPSSGGTLTLPTGGGTITWASVPTVTGIVSTSCSTAGTTATVGSGYLSYSGCPIFSTGSITIYGTNFYSGSFTSNACNGNYVFGSSGSSSYFSCDIASKPSLSSSITVTVTTYGGTSTTTAVALTYSSPPTISSVSIYQTGGGTSILCGGSTSAYTNCPTSGNDASGNPLQVTITGTNFISSGFASNLCSGTISVSCSSGTCTATCNLVSSSSSTSGTSITGSVTSGGATVFLSSATVTFPGLPTVAGVVGPSSCTNAGTGAYTTTASYTSATGCNAAGGSSTGYLTIYGTNFYGIATVSSVCQSSVTPTSDTELLCYLAGGSSSSIAISVVSNGGTSTTTGYTVGYAQAPTISAISYSNSGVIGAGTTVCYPSGNTLLNCPKDGGGTITITGTGLSGASSLTGICSSPSVASDGSSMTCTLLSVTGASSVTTTLISFTASGGSFVSSSSYSVSWAAMPIVSTAAISSGCSSTAAAAAVHGCSTSGGGLITFTGIGFYSAVTIASSPSPCVSTPVITSTTTATCTLVSGSAGTTYTVLLASIGGTSTTSVTISYTTNSFSVSPVFGTPSLSTVSVTFTPSAAGMGYVYVVATGGTAATAATFSSLTSLCPSTASAPLTAGTSVTISASSCTTLGSSVANVDVYVYVDSSTLTVYGAVSSLTNQAICHPDCTTCSAAASASSCSSCTSTTLSGGYCCHSSCSTCSVPSGSTSASGIDACLVCASATTRKSRQAYGSGSFYLIGSAAANSVNGRCCYERCVECSAPSSTNNGFCTKCPGREVLGTSAGVVSNSGGYCLGPGGPSGTTAIDSAEIHGDPHFKGFKNQEFTISGLPDAVYNVITDTNVQYNTRFVWYGDVYHGVDPTDMSKYDANVTYIGEAAFKFRTHTGEETRILYSAHTGQLTVDGKVLPPSDKRVRIAGGVVSVLVSSSSRKVLITSHRFEFQLYLAGSHAKPLINQEVRVLDWNNIASHGLLGQTWKKLPDVNYNRNAIWRNHTPGIDFQFRQAEFLEGTLGDYKLASGDIWGDDFAFDLYKR